MATMDHMCINCGHFEFNNTSTMREPCPECGACNWSSSFDEDGDDDWHDDIDDEWDEEEEDDE